jgi:hypothetical protein
MPNENANLARGPEVRSARATMKRAMREDPELALEVLAGRSEQWEPVAADMTIESLLLVLGLSPRFVSATLDHRRIRPTIQAFGLTAERREELATRAREELTR